jgi:preprotein translocase subunit SecF
VELFRDINIDWLGKSKLYLAISGTLILASLLVLFTKGIPLGVDFRGGTLVYVKFAQAPNEGQIRDRLNAAGIKEPRIQRYGADQNHEVLIALEQQQTSEAALSQGRDQIINALEGGQAQAGKQDLNNTGRAAIQSQLMQRDPLRAGTEANQRYSDIAGQITTFRDQDRGGVLSSLDQLSAVVDPKVVQALQQDFYVSNFTVRNVEIVGPQVGNQLQKQAVLATLYATIGMLIYLWFRFEMIYGAASVAAVIHDVTITLGIFSMLRKEISLTVIAAMLTLVGYSMNDTIVIFDRIRENLKLMRRQSLFDIGNTSINQTLSRTFLTTFLTFITVASLLFFGGEVLHGFSFALFVGIILGTYSTIGVAAPLVVAYDNWRRRGRGPAAVPAESGRREKVRAKA